MLAGCWLHCSMKRIQINFKYSRVQAGSFKGRLYHLRIVIMDAEEQDALGLKLFAVLQNKIFFFETSSMNTHHV